MGCMYRDKTIMECHSCLYRNVKLLEVLTPIPESHKARPLQCSAVLSPLLLSLIGRAPLCQDATRLPSITDLEPNSHQEASAELREQVRASVELFLQVKLNP